MNDTQSKSLTKPIEPAQPTGIARRRLLRAGMASVPVALTLSGRSAMATQGYCGLSPTSWASVAPNGTILTTSHNVQVHEFGHDPDAWKPKCGSNVPTFDHAWPDDCKPFITKKTKTNAENKEYSKASCRQIADLDINDAEDEKRDPKKGFKSGKKFNDLFTGQNDTRSCSLILLSDTSSDAVKKCLVTAYLNACNNSGYAIRKDEVISLANTRCLGNSKQQLTDRQIIDFCNQTWNSTCHYS